MARFWQVALCTAPFSILSYEQPESFPELQVGLRVLVPVRGGLRAGVCIQECPQPNFATKPLLWPLETTPLLNQQWLAMASDLALRQSVPLAKVLATLLPTGLRTTEIVYTCAAPDVPARISPQQIHALQEQERTAFLQAWRDGAVHVHFNPRKEANAQLVCLACEPPWRVRPRALRQRAVLEYLHEHGSTSVGDLSHVCGHGTKAVVDTLVRNGLLAWDRQTQDIEKPSARVPEHISTAQQQAVISELLALMREHKGNTALLHGVTGSGKTHVYLSLIQEALEQGNSSLLLAPEVALAMQLFQVLRARFGENRVFLYHGYLSSSRKLCIFQEIGKCKEPCIVVGTRSALFLPFQQLGLLVIDEEHDESFKQEERLLYQAKEVAWKRIQESGGLLVLGSATPDIKTFYATCTGNVPLLTLPQRVGEGKLPTIELIDISKHSNQDVPLVPEVQARLLATVQAGEQVMIMLNRRGYAPIMYCLSCGEALKCPACNVGLTYHKKQQRLLCHYCGIYMDYPTLCPSCGGTKHLPMGGGTERIEEYVHKILPEETSLLRLDRDSTRKPEYLEHILDEFRTGKAQVLIGTQMLSKGHHFPGVTLVIVVEGDLGLNLPEYRSAERTFQMLVQVSGRAGRGNKAGTVLIQTRNPQHPLWQNILDADYKAFYTREVLKREQFGYPPFVFLALVRMSYSMYDSHGLEYLSEAGDVLRNAAMQSGISVLGPSPAPFAQLNNRKRYNCLLKGKDWATLRGVFVRLMEWNLGKKKLRISLDLDPLSML